MNDLQSIKDRAADLKLSLEAASGLKKAEAPQRTLAEMMADWKDKPLKVSPTLKALLAPKESDNV